jgi:coenzyme Q-binding protein COQ10
MPAVTRSILINRSIEDVYNVITDFESYPEFLPDMSEVNVIKMTKAKAEIEFKLNIFTTIKYTLELTFKRPTSVTWKLVKGDMMSKNTGSWSLKEKGEGKTEAAYSIDAELGLLVPKSITNVLVGSNLPKMLKSFKERVEG